MKMQALFAQRILIEDLRIPRQRPSALTNLGYPNKTKKRPVPVAHLSFITKSTTEPSERTRFPFVSLPPPSINIPGRFMTSNAFGA